MYTSAQALIFKDICHDLIYCKLCCGPISLAKCCTPQHVTKSLMAKNFKLQVLLCAVASFFKSESNSLRWN